MKTLLQLTRIAHLYKKKHKIISFSVRTAELESVQFKYLIIRKSKHFYR